MMTKQETEEEKQERLVNIEIEEFYNGLTLYGFMDVHVAIEFF